MVKRLKKREKHKASYARCHRKIEEKNGPGFQSGMGDSADAN